METNKKEKNFSTTKNLLGDISGNNFNKLERFTKNKNQKRIIVSSVIGIVLLVGAITLYRMFDLYEEKIEFNVLQGGVPEYTSRDVKMAAIIDAVKSDTIPGKNDGYVFESVTCDNEAIGEWDNDKWSLFVGNLSKSKTICTLTFKGLYKESILNGADPVLKDNLIPVIIDNTGKVTKADEYSEWYSYEKKNWANAVILEDESVTYEEGETIPESNIESYFVWIPRYKYKIWTNGNYANDAATINAARDNGIDIIFENKDTTPSTDTSVGSYYTHPAFVSMNTNGLWIGKFETGYRDAASTSAAEVNTENSSKVVIKPNVYSWRGIQPVNAFYTTYNYQRSLDSHMMKNIEWGAVAYLTNSQYGRCTNDVCTEVTINNNSNFITGYAGNTVSASGAGTTLGVDGTTTYNYKNLLSNLASTTGNYTGIYDMSGGSWEYVMGVMLDSTNTSPLSGYSSSYNSGFKGNYGTNGSNTTGKDFPERKYYDAYQYGTSNIDYARFKYGDATGELGTFTSGKSSWYSDRAYFVRSATPWFARGGGCSIGTDAGLFFFSSNDGRADSGGSFRVVLAI